MKASIWEISPAEENLTIAPGIHLDKACDCRSCARSGQPPGTIAYLRFRPPNTNKGLTVFIENEDELAIIAETLNSAGIHDEQQQKWTVPARGN